jgi:hypothetical protein
MADSGRLCSGNRARNPKPPTPDSRLHRLTDRQSYIDAQESWVRCWIETSGRPVCIAGPVSSTVSPLPEGHMRREGKERDILRGQIRPSFRCPSLSTNLHAVVDVGALFDSNRLQSNGLAVALPAIDRVRTRKTVEQVIEGAVLLHDHNDMFDFLRLHRQAADRAVFGITATKQKRIQTEQYSKGKTIHSPTPNRWRRRMLVRGKATSSASFISLVLTSGQSRSGVRLIP